MQISLLTAMFAGILLWWLEVRANCAILVTLGMSVKSMIRNQDSFLHILELGAHQSKLDQAVVIIRYHHHDTAEC